MKKISTIDLDMASRKISIHHHDRTHPLIIWFDTPARRFYFSLIALIVYEMKQKEHPGFIYIRKHEDMLRQLDNSISGKFASKSTDNMWAKIKMAWRQRLPDLETASLFKVEDRDMIQPYEKGGKCRYDCSDEECDMWANLFQYDENNIWRFKFAVDSISLNLEDVHLSFGALKGQSAWQEYVKNLTPPLSDDRDTPEEQQITCRECGAEQASFNLLCSVCGTSLKASNKTPDVAVYPPPHTLSPIFSIPKVPVVPVAIEGERKMVTVLCIELFDITQLTETHDPEDIHQFISFLYDILDEHIQLHNGIINQFVEDGVMALFGAPVAQEDHAQHACYAALSISKTLSEKAGEIKKRFGIPLHVCMGLNSDLVVAGTIGGEQQRIYTAVGNTIHIANRLKHLAAPGTIMVSANTYKLVKDYFEVKPYHHAAKNGKGFKNAAYRLIRAGAHETRFEIAGIKGFTTFVGRERTITNLLNTFDKANAGSSQVVLLFGEAGAGKSRVLHEFTKLLPEDECLYLEGKCLHHGVTMPCLPVLDILRNYFDIQPNDNETVIHHKIETRTRNLELFQHESIGFIRELLSVGSHNSLYRQLDPEQRRKMTFTVIKDLLFNTCREKPLVVGVEDCHWIDRTSEDFFLHLISYLGNHKIMMVMVYRPEYTFQQMGTVEFTHINLSPLTPQSSLELVQVILKSQEIDPGLEKFIFERSAGNPLIIEEIIYSLIEQDAIANKDGYHALNKDTHEITLPDTIRGIIAARIDRLEDTLKMIIQTGAVIGKVFSYDILMKVTGTEADLRYLLLSLQRMDFIYERETVAASEYIFKHALIQEVAYDSLLIKQRRKIHARTSRAIEELFADRIENFYGELAYHYEKTEIREKTIHYLLLAGERAKAIFANEEAIDFYKRGIDQISVLLSAKQAERQKWQRVMAQVQEDLAEVLELTGMHEEARQSYQKALDYSCKRDAIRQSRIHRKIGKTWEVQSVHEKVVQCYDMAETVLNRYPNNADREWHVEWIEIQLARLLLYYWRAQLKEMEELVARTRSNLERYGTPSQRASFFNMLTLKDYRHFRYLLPEKSLDNPHCALEASQTSGDLKLICWTRFLLGFSYLWCDKYDEAQNILQESLKESETIGDVVNQSRCLTYLTIAYRRANKFEQVRELLPQCLEVAQKAQMNEYVGTAKANSAWLSWFHKEYEQVEILGQSALETWDQLPVTHASCGFKWTAIWPLMGIAITDDHNVKAVEYAKMLLEPKQKRLPEALTAALKKAIAYWETDQNDKASIAFRKSLQLAREMAYV